MEKYLCVKRYKAPNTMIFNKGDVYEAHIGLFNHMEVINRGFRCYFGREYFVKHFILYTELDEVDKIFNTIMDGEIFMYA